jgi:hypothetical protein
MHQLSKFILSSNCTWFGQPLCPSSGVFYYTFSTGESHAGFWRPLPSRVRMERDGTCVSKKSVSSVKPIAPLFILQSSFPKGVCFNYLPHKCSSQQFHIDEHCVVLCIVCVNRVVLCTVCVNVYCTAATGCQNPIAVNNYIINPSVLASESSSDLSFFTYCHSWCTLLSQMCLTLL